MRNFVAAFAGWGRRACLIAVALLPLAVVAGESRDDAAITINRVKAAYLYNFTKFVSWPDSAFTRAEQPLVIGVLDQADGTMAALVTQELGGKTAADGRPIVVRGLAAAAEAIDVHILFVTQASGADVSTVRRALAGRAVLLVGETGGFAERGGVINFAVTGDSVRCEINLRSADRAVLKLSSRLASVARLVRDQGDGP